VTYRVNTAVDFRVSYNAGLYEKPNECSLWMAALWTWGDCVNLFETGLFVNL